MSCVHFPRKRRKKSFLIAYISMLVCGINLHFSITIIFLCRAWFFSIICTMLAFFFEGKPKTQRFEQIEIANKRELGRLTKWIEAKQEKNIIIIASGWTNSEMAENMADEWTMVMISFCDKRASDYSPTFIGRFLCQILEYLHKYFSFTRKTEWRIVLTSLFWLLYKITTATTETISISICAWVFVAK